MHRRFFLSAAAASAAGAALPPVARAQTVAARVGFIPIVGAAPIFIADREGWLKEKGVQAAFTVFESGPNMIQAVASGTIDVYVAGVAPLAVARSRGVDVRVVAATAVGENVVAANPKLAAHFKPGVAAAQALKSFRAETGKAAKFATQPAGSVPNTTLQYWLWEVAKADKADVEIVQMGIDATQQALLAGAVDAASVREPAVSIVQARNPGVRLLATGDEVFPGQPGTVVAVSGAFAVKNPDAIQAIVTGVVRAIALAQTSPDRVVPHVEAALGKGIVDAATIKRALASPATKFLADPRAIVEPARAMQAYQMKLGSLEKELPFEGLFDSRFYERAMQGG
jgi:NitT/TauT family transport system substrate-binding protein